MGINFLSKMKVVEFVSSMEKMSNLRIDLGRVSNLSILHLEMVKIEGPSQNCWRVDLTYVTHNCILFHFRVYGLKGNIHLV